MENKLPQQNESQRRGMQAEDILSSVLSKFSFVNRIDNSVDIGVDFICEHRNEDKPTGKIFNVQCKAIPVGWTKGEEIGFSIKVKTARYWLQLPNITILMVVDPKNGNLYWANPIENLVKRNDNWRTQETIQIKVPESSLFNCFKAEPKDLLVCAMGSSNHISVSLYERLYDVRNSISEEQPKGIFPNATVVAKTLMHESPLQDAIKASKALEEFQSDIYEKLIARADKYSSQLYPFIEKWHGKHLRRQGVHSNPLEMPLNGMFPTEILSSARDTLKKLKTNKHQRNFDNLLKTLDELEILERSASEIESIEYEREKPLLKILMKQLESSGANIINDNEL
tara:strand:- start:5963 stop:6982 length:1020 start_codon:yes stop_codon:yes gene_type:complete